MSGILTTAAATYAAQTLRGTNKVDVVARADAEVADWCTGDWANDVDEDLVDVNKWFVGTSSAGIAGNTSVLLGGLDVREDLWLAGAESGDAHADADDLIVGDGVGNRGMTIFAATTGLCGIHFTDMIGGGVGAFNYDNSNLRFSWWVEGSEEMSLDTASLRPLTDGGLTLGDADQAWTSLYVKDGITAPGTPTTGAVIYVDTADGDLKVKFSDGFVAILAADS